jgi:hypothetical protein
MLSLYVLFWMYVILFAIIGAMRGWAKELMVTFSIALALFIITVLETYVGIVRNSISATGGTAQFWMRTIIVIMLVFFGYQTPNIKALAGARFAREHLQDTLLGFLLGAFNGYLVVGTIWWYMHQAGYPFANVILPLQPGFPNYDAAIRMINMLPPEWLTIPWIYFAVGIAFLFVIIVFI